MEIITGTEIKKALQEKTYQNPFEETEKCVKCGKLALPILIVDDEDGELANNPPPRNNGIPIFPHDSCIFVLYLCSECGEVTTSWNQG